MGDRLFNKVAVVTGASGRIGRAIVQRFVGEGAKVVIFARNRERLDQVAQTAPARIVVVEGDVTNDSDLEHLAQTTVRRFGGVDILVPAASLSRQATLEDCTRETTAQIVAVNFEGALQTARIFLRHVNSRASIVFLSGSLPDLTSAGFAIVGASRAAISSLAKSLAIELQPRGIRVNCVAPRWTFTAETMTSGSAQLPTKSDPATRLINNVAEVVVFFASDASTIAGQEIGVDLPAAEQG